MSVILETSLGDIEVELYVDDAPKTCTNFLKLCKIKYFNGCLFHTVQKDFNIQTGDPDGSGRGGSSIWGMLFGEQARFFDDEFDPKHPPLHDRPGLLSTGNLGPNKNTSTFFITTGNNLRKFDGKHTVFGEVVEGLDIVQKINEAYCDDEGHPYKVIRIRHTIVVEDPFEDPKGLVSLIPERSPEPKRMLSGRLDDEEPDDPTEGKTVEELNEERANYEASIRTSILMMVGDIKEGNKTPPENVLFIRSLHPVTSEADLDMIFSQFGNVVGCQIIRDPVTKDSLCYGFIEFADRQSCERAYLKMDNCIIDDRRVRVDFSQSTSRNSEEKNQQGGRYGHLTSRSQQLQIKASSTRHVQESDFLFDHSDQVHNEAPSSAPAPAAASKRPRDETKSERRDSPPPKRSRDSSSSSGSSHRSNRRSRSRSRSRSPDRRQDRNRDRERERGSHKRDKSRSPERDRKRSRSPHRRDSSHRDREHDRERDRDRDRDRDHDRDRDRHRERDRR